MNLLHLAKLTYSWNDVNSLQICCCLEDVFRKLFSSKSNKDDRINQVRMVGSCSSV